MCPIEFVTPSPQALKAAEEKVSKSEPKYPIDKLAVGQSFTIPIGEGNYQSLKSLTSTKSKDGKRYIVIMHDGLNLIEVYRKS